VLCIAENNPLCEAGSRADLGSLIPCSSLQFARRIILWPPPEQPRMARYRRNSPATIASTAG
jgi:hypothetical protein